jgi:hypothetical protein
MYCWLRKHKWDYQYILQSNFILIKKETCMKCNKEIITKLDTNFEIISAYLKLFYSIYVPESDVDWLL